MMESGTPRPQTPRHGTRHAPRANRFFKKLKSWAFASEQNSSISSLYSTPKTALPASTNRSRRSHSSYWWCRRRTSGRSVPVAATASSSRARASSTPDTARDRASMPSARPRGRRPASSRARRRARPALPRASCRHASTARSPSLDRTRAIHSGRSSLIVESMASVCSIAPISHAALCEPRRSWRGKTNWFNASSDPTWSPRPAR